MKFVLAVGVYGVIGVLVAVGLLMTVALAKPWLLLLALAGYLLAFARFGCLNPS